MSQYRYDQVPIPPKEPVSSLQGIFTQSARVQHPPTRAFAPWRQGAWRHVPWTAFFALLLSIFATVVMAAVLVFSNSKSADWSVQPAVLLAIASAVANIMIRYALSEGIEVAWWVKSLKQGTKLSDLHNIWSYGTSLKAALLSGTSFNLVALAGILVSITPINGPLLQRASTVSVRSLSTMVDLKLPIAQEFPDGYTGIITGRGHLVALTTSNFSAIVKDFANGKSVNLSSSGCNGRCSGSLRGAGYAINCASFQQEFNLSSALSITPNGDVNTAITNGTDVFMTSFIYNENQYDKSPLNFSATYKTTPSCDGWLSISNCTLQPAIVEYSVLLSNNTISLDPGSTYKDDRIVRLTPPWFNVAQGGSTHGGMAFALNSLFKSSSHLRFTGAVGYDIQSFGAPAIEYSASFLNSSNIYGCPVTWSDPTSDMLATARQLAFRVAIAAANISNATNIQTMTAHQNTQVIVYNTHYLYLGLALLLTLIPIFSILPTFFGWWRLGRTVSMSPIEVAKAFDAPQLAGVDSNADAKTLLKTVGDRPVKYGAVTLGPSVNYDPAWASAPERLVMTSPGFVHEPVNGRVFIG